MVHAPRPDRLDALDPRQLVPHPRGQQQTPASLVVPPAVMPNPEGVGRASSTSAIRTVTLS